MQTKLSGKSKKASLELWGSTILFIVLAIVIILPIWLLLIASFKPGGDLLQYGLNLDINFSRMSLDNFVLLFTGQHEYWTWFFNSIFLRLIVPIMKPAFSAMAILNGMNAWNNYLWPLLVIRSSDKYTLTLGLNTLINPYGDNYSLLIVGSLFSIIPIFILFIAFQKYFIEGMTAGAVKG